MNEEMKEFFNAINVLQKYTGETIISNARFAEVQEEYRMKERQKYLDMHDSKISYSDKDGYYRTRIKDSSYANGYKMIKATTKEKLEDKLADHYKNKEIKQCKESYEFSCCWEKWRQRQISYGVASNTVDKYNADYRRFFEDTDFEKRDIRTITEEDITAFMVQKITQLNLKSQASKELWGQITGVFEMARTRHSIKENPCTYVEKRIFEKHYNKEQKPIEERTFTKEELCLLKKQISTDHENKPLYIQPYAVELAMYTGMRVGELAALRWANVLLVDGIIVISESEKHIRKTNTYEIAGTKTGKIRHFPMTEEIRSLLRTVKKLQMQNNILGEFVFSNERGKVTARSISECLRYKCKQVGIKERGIHALRRTLNSQMRCNGVPTVIAAALLGHTEEVNQSNYTYDISGMDYKRECVRNAIV